MEQCGSFSKYVTRVFRCKFTLNLQAKDRPGDVTATVLCLAWPASLANA